MATSFLQKQLSGLKRPFTTGEARSRGVSRAVLSRAVKEGRLARRCRGVYEFPGAPVEHFNIEFENLVRLGVPFVATLISALRLHDLTDQLPHQLWIAVPSKADPPNPGGPPVQCVRVKEPAFSFGVETVDGGGFDIPVYSAAKTVADCFKFRNRIGLDVAVEALHDGWRKKKFTADQLMAAARVDRVENVMRPYAEGMLIP